MSSVSEFFDNKTIFITGGSGLVGQILIEKLLRCFNVYRIYILIRDKKGKTWQERIQKMCDDELFDKVRATKPNFIEKLIGIVGDCQLPGLGLKPMDRQLLIDNVNIVFHSAATVNFNEKLSLSLKINVLGTQSIVRLCHHMKNLLSFVYVSTAYSNPFIVDKEIEEKFYDPPTLNASDALQLLESVGDETIDAISNELLKDFPNTYCFTKHLAEDVIKNEGVGLPVAVFRPAIIIATAQEPVPGWINNIYGPTGVIYGIARGVIRVFYIKPSNTAVFVPADMCINNMLAIAWDLGNKNCISEIPIYNFVTHDDNTLTYQQLLDQNWSLTKKIPCYKTAWYYCFESVENVYKFRVLHFLYHLLPAFFIDLILCLMGHRLRLTKIYDRVIKMSQIFEFFAFTKFSWRHDNVTKLFKKLSDTEKVLLNFDMENLNWVKFFDQAALGARWYLMKEPISNLPAARRKQKILRVVHYGVTLSFKLLLVYFVLVFLKFILFS